MNNFFSQDGLNVLSLLWSQRTCSLSSYNDVIVDQLRISTVFLCDGYHETPVFVGN